MSPPPCPVLALDIGGTKLATGVVGPDGDLSGLQIAPTHRDHGPDQVIARLFDLGRASMAASAAHPPGAIGVSCGGPLDTRTGVLFAPNHLPAWDRVPIARLASEAFGLPAYLDNDATAAAWGEYRWGLGTACSSMIYLTLSTGIGGGAVLQDRLHRGGADNGGEFGHVTVRPGGRPCTCRRRGCLEAYCSGTSIAARAREALAANGESSLLRDVPGPTAIDVVAAVRSGDRLAERIWSETTDLIGQAVTDMVNVFEPEMVVLGGGVSGAGELLIDPVRQRVAAQAMPPAAATCRIERSALGDHTSLLGAGAIAFDRLAHAEI